MSGFHLRTKESRLWCSEWGFLSALCADRLLCTRAIAQSSFTGGSVVPAGTRNGVGVLPWPYAFGCLVRRRMATRSTSLALETMATIEMQEATNRSIVAAGEWRERSALVVETVDPASGAWRHLAVCCRAL